MNAPSTYSIMFYIRNDKAKNNEIPIYARITVEGKRSELSIKRTVPRGKWNNKSGLAKGNTESINNLNNYIHLVRSQLNNHFKKLLEDNTLITADAIKNSYLGKTAHKKTIVEVFEYHNSMMRSKIGIDFAKGTLTRYETTLKHIKEFMYTTYKKRDMFLTELNYAFVIDLEHYLKTVRKCGHNSTIKYIRNFKKIVIIAIRNEWLNKDPFIKYTTSLKEVKRDFLNEDELDKIHTKDLNLERLNEVRDIFVFCCYTGLAYTDVQNLTGDNIQIGIDGSKWIFIERQKTGTDSKVPLLPIAEDILEKYKENPYCVNSDKLLPVKSNQKVNAYLKEIATICDIKKNITFHIARHTFATTVTLTNNVPIESVSSMLGHKNIKTTQIYSKVVEKKVSADMMILKERLTNKDSAKIEHNKS